MAVDRTGITSLDTLATLNAIETGQPAGWTEDVDLVFDDLSPAKAAEGKTSIDLAALGYKKVVVQIAIAFSSTIDGNAEIRVRKSADSGTTKDTILAAGSTEVTYLASNTKRITLEFSEIPWVEIGVYNNTSTAGDITPTAKYAGLKYTNL